MEERVEEKHKATFIGRGIKRRWTLEDREIQSLFFKFVSAWFPINILTWCKFELDQVFEFVHTGSSASLVLLCIRIRLYLMFKNLSEAGTSYDGFNETVF